MSTDNRGAPSLRSDSFISFTSQTPLNNNQGIQSADLQNSRENAAPAMSNTPGNDTTFFLLDIEAPAEEELDNGDNASVSSQTSSNSSSSSISAQVVIDHGSSLPRRLEKSGAGHLLRAGDDESESDYAYSLTSTRRELEVPSSSSRARHRRSTGPERRTSIVDMAADGAKLTNAEEREFSFDKIGKGKGHQWRRTAEQKESDAESIHKAGGVTVYTDEQEDLMDEIPSWDQERMRRQSVAHYISDDKDEHYADEVDAQLSARRRLKKRAQRALQADLQSHSWSRRESLQGNRDSGLSSEQALNKLLRIARQILGEEKAQIETKIGKYPLLLDIRDWIFRSETLLSLFTAFSLLAFFIAGYLKSDPYQYRVTAALVESILVLLMTLWNGYLYRREQILTYWEMSDRAATIIAALERSGMNMVQDTKIPFIPSMTVAKVVRDGVVRIFPVNLLVEGDVVEMLYGDVAPGRMKYIHKPTSLEDIVSRSNKDTSSNEQSRADQGSKNDLQTREYYLAQDQTFKPSFFGIPPPAGLMEEYLHARGRHQFILLETPLEKNLRTALTQQRPATVIANETRVITRIFYRYIIWIMLSAALLVNLLRFGLRDRIVNNSPVDQLAELLLALPLYVILPLLPFCLPSLWIIARCFGNAQLLILFEALQISKTEYEDDDEVDEFDAEAPPPTKDVELSPNAVWDRFCSLLSSWDNLSLTRSTNLFESLGSTTVICCLDREGTIANAGVAFDGMPFPTAEQLMFPNMEDDISSLDVEEDEDGPFGIKFEEQDWEQYLPYEHATVENDQSIIVVGQSSMCMEKQRVLDNVCSISVAHESADIVLEEALQSFALRAEIYTFAPYHEILNTPRYQYSQYFSFEVPNALSTVFEEKDSGSYQLLTDGHPSLVLDKCSDYWDGSSLQTMSGTMEKKINDFFHNALVHDMQCIAYAYRPINTANGQRISFLNPSNDEQEDPGCAFVVLPYKSPNSDSSNSNSSCSSDEEESLSPAPSNTFSSLRRSIEEGNTGESSTKREASSAKRRRRRRRRPSKDTSSSDEDDALSEGTSTDYSFEEDEPVDEQEEETFYKEVVKGQIFLGMAAMCHQPKQNVVDFIEDLGLAGIRFVYFSPTAERESKAFAERLGLETDWNSCILLSSPDDENCGNGYLQTHDIKAQLPRGIDQIRPHIEDVDDIPLHVSLFAECTPSAMKEMIRVFQEYGEVVCCIGNALNIKNTESFALADVSIAMEPMHTRAQSKGRLSLNGRQPPLAVGASLVSLPCGLFMQYETSLYAVTQLIRDARRLLSCVRMGFSFYIGACMALSVMQLVSLCMLLPPLLSGYQILWVMWIIIPILSVSMLFSPHDDNIMLMMPGKNIEHLTDLWRFLSYFALRFLLCIAMCIAIYILTLVYLMDVKVIELFGSYGSHGWLHWSAEEQWAVLYAQNFMLIVFVWYLAWMSCSFLHRTSSLIEFVPFRNKVWVAAFFVSISLQFCFCAVSLSHGSLPLVKIPWFIYFLGFIWPIVLVPMQELVKMHDNKEFSRFQKRSKLEFSTKLGMHSPL
ncbi:hypothetical protein DFQ29_008573 [Apophysomyces sp. BC1021]|nr:hypothetical protein DFQ29_008573 [Apophysomyces sp. BC1021]